MKTLFALILAFITSFSSFSQTIIKGPYLLYPNNNTQMTVMWQTNATANAIIYWGTTQTYGNSISVSEYGNDHQFKYTITGLTPMQKYYYKIEVAGTIKESSFITAPDNNAQNLTFYIYGDTRAHPEVQNNVTGRILTEINNNPASQTFCLNTGDCVTHGRTEGDWQNQFFNTSYSNNETLKSMVPYLLARGNHENYNANYNSGYATKFYKYWPYTFASNATNGDDMYYSFDYGPVHIAVLDQYDNGTYNNAQLSATQLSWLQNDLTNSNKTWKFILLHEPGWSARYTSRSEHGNNTDVQNNIQPLCIQHNVKAVFGGHNHYYAHCNVDDINHFTLGGGGAPLYSPSHTSGGIIVYAEATYHFMKVQIQGDNATLTAIRPDGSIVETINLQVPASIKDNIYNKVNIYPNPSNGHFSIQTPNDSSAEISIIDIFGRQIMKKRISSNNKHIDISKYSNGIYILSIKIGNQIIKKTIVNKQ